MTESGLKICHIAWLVLFKVYRCACDDCADVNPNVVAQKLFNDQSLNGFNMTDMRLIRTEVSAGGVGAELFWFHEQGRDAYA